jgi:uncharacterized protein YozE (UPF0346 family)
MSMPDAPTLAHAREAAPGNAYSHFTITPGGHVDARMTGPMSSTEFYRLLQQAHPDIAPKWTQGDVPQWEDTSPPRTAAKYECPRCHELAYSMAILNKCPNCGYRLPNDGTLTPSYESWGEQAPMANDITWTHEPQEWPPEIAQQRQGAWEDEPEPDEEFDRARRDMARDDLQESLKPVHDKMQEIMRTRGMGEPDWEPLRAVIPPSHMDSWMFMGYGQHGERAYKHSDTRKYLSLIPREEMLAHPELGPYLPEHPKRDGTPRDYALPGQPYIALVPHGYNNPHSAVPQKLVPHPLEGAVDRAYEDIDQLGGTHPFRDPPDTPRPREASGNLGWEDDKFPRHEEDYDRLFEWAEQEARKRNHTLTHWDRPYGTGGSAKCVECGAGVDVDFSEDGEPVWVGNAVSWPCGQNKMMQPGYNDVPETPGHVHLDPMERQFAAPPHTGAVWQEATHYNPWTGLPCSCPYGTHKQRARARRRQGASAFVEKALAQNQKAFRSDVGQQFLKGLNGLVTEYPDAEAMTPWLASRFKHGDVSVHPESGWPMWARNLNPGRAMERTNTQAEQAGGQRVYNNPLAYAQAALSDPSHDAHHHYRPVHQRISQWAQWYNAREHPTRRGYNVMEMSPTEVDTQVQEHQRDLALKRAREDWLHHHGETGAQVHQWDAGPFKGWQVKQLQDEYDCEAESEALGHCIGQDGQPYKRNIVAGNFDAFSLRDPDGYPHVTWHFNPDGSLAHLQGKSGEPKDEYRDLITDFHKRTGKSDYEEGEQDYDNLDAERYVQLPEPESVEDYMAQYHPDTDQLYDLAREWAENDLHDDVEIDRGAPDWEAIYQDLAEERDPAKRSNFYNTVLSNHHPHRVVRHDDHHHGLASEIDAWRKAEPEEPIHEQIARELDHHYQRSFNANGEYQAPSSRYDHNNGGYGWQTAWEEINQPLFTERRPDMQPWERDLAPDRRLDDHYVYRSHTAGEVVQGPWGDVPVQQPAQGAQPMTCPRCRQQSYQAGEDVDGAGIVHTFYHCNACGLHRQSSDASAVGIGVPELPPHMQELYEYLHGVPKQGDPNTPSSPQVAMDNPSSPDPLPGSLTGSVRSTKGNGRVRRPGRQNGSTR